MGGLCAVIHGAPVHTIDVDIVHCRTDANLDGLLIALDKPGARSRLHRSTELKPDRTHLSSPGYRLLTTRAGSLDLIGVVGRGRDYEALLPHTMLVEVAEGLPVRVRDLETLIQVTEETGAEKDRIALSTLRATQAERRRGG